MTDIGNKCRIRVGDQVRFESRQGSAQLGKAQTGLGGEFYNNHLFIKRCNKIVNCINIFVNRQIRSFIYLIQADNQLLRPEIDLGNHQLQIGLNGRILLRHIQHSDHDFGFGNLPEGALDAHLFDGLSGLADAGGVDETEGDSVQVDDFFDGVAGGAGDVRDERA